MYMYVVDHKQCAIFIFWYNSCIFGGFTLFVPVEMGMNTPQNSYKIYN